MTLDSKVTQETPETYRLRGHRVAEKTPAEIHSMAINFCKIFHLQGQSIREVEKLIDKLSACRLMTIESIESEEWNAKFSYANGHYDPFALRIRLPDHVIDSIYSEDPNKQKDALHTFFHEIGHFSLGHRALLHEVNTPPSMYEDAEYQADLFAEEVLLHLGFIPRQMSFEF